MDALTPSPPLGLLDLSEFEAASGVLVINPGDRVLLTAIQADVVSFSGGRLRDDAAMLMLEVDRD